MSSPFLPNMGRHWSPIGWPGVATSTVDMSGWLMDNRMRDASASGGGGAALTGSPGGTAGGDLPPIRPSKVAGPMPFTFQPGGNRRAGFGTMQANGQFVATYDPSHGHQGSQGGTTQAGVYGHHQVGGPGQMPNQPYRASAGFRVLAYTPQLARQVVPAQLAGGPKTGGVPTQQALTSQIAAILSARRQPAPAKPGTLTGVGVGSRGTSQIGMAYNRSAALSGTQPTSRRK